VLKAEIGVLQEKHWPDIQIMFLNSILHMHPEQLAHSLQHLLEVELDHGQEVVLVYGDCCRQMAAMTDKHVVVRTRCNNCCDLLLGREEYRRLSHERVFFLIPEWIMRWREIFTEGLGLDRAIACSFMQDMHSRLVYLDTGIGPVPEKELAECAEYCGLPYEVRPMLLENLRTSVEEALLNLEKKASGT